MPREQLDRLLFFFSVLFLLFVGAFSYGYFVATTKRFPHRIITHALKDVDDVLNLVRANAHEIRSSRRQGGVTIHEASLAQPGLTFFTAYDGQLFRPFLVDMDGNVVHRWETHYSAFFKRGKLDLVSDTQRHLHGAHLYSDGSILASFEFKALAKLDRCSRPVWLLRRATHHAILPLPDGSFLTLSHDKKRDRPYLDKGHFEDSILHVSANGEVLEEINIIEAILKGRYQNLLLQGEPWRPESNRLIPSTPTTSSSSRKSWHRGSRRPRRGIFSSRCNARVRSRSSAARKKQWSGAWSDRSCASTTPTSSTTARSSSSTIEPR